MLVLGRGRLGTSLAAALDVPLAAARTWRDALPIPPHALVFLAVPDQHVPAVAREFAGHLREAQALVHLSGALPLGALDPAARRGSFHPLQSFPTPKSRAHFSGVTIGIAATDVELRSQLEGIAVELNAIPLPVPDDQRTLYHAAAVTAGPSLVALVATAVDVLAGLGWTKRAALAALLPLVRGTLANLEDDGLPGALIGPVRRGDSETVERQLVALSAAAPQAADVYLALARKAVALAREAGLDPVEAGRIEAVLSDRRNPGRGV